MGGQRWWRDQEVYHLHKRTCRAATSMIISRPAGSAQLTLPILDSNYRTLITIPMDHSGNSPPTGVHHVPDSSTCSKAPYTTPSGD